MMMATAIHGQKHGQAGAYDEVLLTRFWPASIAYTQEAFDVLHQIFLYACSCDVHIYINEMAISLTLLRHSLKPTTVKILSTLADNVDHATIRNVLHKTNFHQSSVLQNNPMTIFSVMAGAKMVLWHDIRTIPTLIVWEWVHVFRSLLTMNSAYKMTTMNYKKLLSRTDGPNNISVLRPPVIATNEISVPNTTCNYLILLLKYENWKERKQQVVFDHNHHRWARKIHEENQSDIENTFSKRSCINHICYRN